MQIIMPVAVGADYNLLLITRIREESASGVRSGIIRAVRSTGGVITSAGIIFAASMFGLLFRQHLDHGADRVHHWHGPVA
jgi:RND superfamily putative drug exporter